eukprot:comp9458_c0_seq1/m.4507 comp9458_c0_seq1/g.4507  ORF comp9458_c0_seq1/g.4507 comp9458_c0_seq1/m.4507 type:complete len:295 (-) comp9458_c0_seq1:378-1262(-)
MRTSAIVLAFAGSALAKGLVLDNGSDYQNSNRSAPDCADANPILELFVNLGNRFLNGTKLLSTRNISLFGLEDNHIDPLIFNGAVKVEAEDEACAEQKCFTIFGKEVCTPRACAGGHAMAELERLTGLGTMLLQNATCLNVTETEEGQLIANGSLVLSCDNITGDAHAEATATILGADIPVSSTGQLGVTEVRPEALLTITLNYTTNDQGKRVYQIDSVNATGVLVHYDDVTFHINNLGIFDGMLGKLTEGIKDIVQKHFDVDGVISQALAKELNQITDDVIPEINKVIKNMAF